MEMHDLGSHPRPTRNSTCMLQFERHCSIIVILELSTLESLEERLMGPIYKDPDVIDMGCCLDIGIVKNSPIVSKSAKFENRGSQ